MRCPFEGMIGNAPTFREGDVDSLREYLCGVRNMSGQYAVHRDRTRLMRRPRSVYWPFKAQRRRRWELEELDMPVVRDEDDLTPRQPRLRRLRRWRWWWGHTVPLDGRSHARMRWGSISTMMRCMGLGKGWVRVRIAERRALLWVPHLTLRVTVADLPTRRNRRVDTGRGRVGKQALNVGRRNDLDEMTRFNVMHLDECGFERDDVGVVQGCPVSLLPLYSKSARREQKGTTHQMLSACLPIR